MAVQHENWIVEAFSGLKATDITALHKLLGQVKQHVTDTQSMIKNTENEAAL
jgi:hypothetical protein